MQLRRDKRCCLGAGLPPLTSEQAAERVVADPADILGRAVQKEFITAGGNTVMFDGGITAFDPEHGYQVHYAAQHGDSESDNEDLGILEAKGILVPLL